LAVDISSIIILVTLFVLFGIFLVFDLFRRNEKWGYLAYIVALVPVNFFWSMGYDPLLAYLILFVLWTATLLRDTIGIYRKKDKEINEILLYLFLAIIIQLIISAILPESIPSLKLFTDQIWFFWLPNVHTDPYPEIVLGFRITATILILLIIVPMILDVKDEEAPLPIIIIFVAIFIIPFLYLSYVWIPDPMVFGTLTFLFSVILFIVLLLITRSGQEVK